MECGLEKKTVFLNGYLVTVLILVRNRKLVPRQEHSSTGTFLHRNIPPQEQFLIRNIPPQEQSRPLERLFFF
tara:strand:+ start:75 stop:290 length:216 start_codon:yes stop_codon:yes gene_type:complete